MEFTLLNAHLKRRNCPSAACVPAADIISRNTDMFSGGSVLVFYFLDPDIFTTHIRNLKEIIRCILATDISCESRF
jgi:hypothetical protein